MKKLSIIILFILCVYVSYCKHFNFISENIYEANFSRVTFNKPVNFRKKTFYINADFLNTKFNSLADFYDTKFDSTANFRFVEFDSTANFRLAKFNWLVSFFNAKFNSKADFSRSRLNSVADFSFAQFDSIVYFNTINFGKDGLLDLSRVSFDGTEICYIDLVGTDLSKVKIRYGNFKLAFDPTNDFNTRETIYLNLRKRLNELNYFDDAIILDKEYKEWVYLEKDPNNRHWIVNASQKYWWGYGYDKYLIAYNTIYIYLFFCFLNLFFIRGMCRKIYKIDLVYNRLEEIKGNKWLKRNLQSIYPIMFYTGLIFFGIYFKTENFKENSIFKGLRFLGVDWKFLGVAYFFIMYGMGLICLGYLANFVLSK